MSATRRFFGSNSGRRAMKIVVDTSLGDGLPQFMIPINLASSIAVQVDGGGWVNYPSVVRPIIPLDDTFTTIHEINILASGSGKTFSMTFNTNAHTGVDLDSLKLIELRAFGNGNVVGQNEFINCSNLVINSEDTPLMRESLFGAFWGINQISVAELERWDFSQATSLNRLCLNMQEPFQAPLSINAPLLTDCFQMLSGVSSNENRFNHDITINAPLVTTCAQMIQGGRYGEGVKITLNTPLNTTLHFALGVPMPDTDLSGVDVSSVTSNNSWIGGAMGTAMADKMLLAWDDLETMQSGVDWNMRGTQITSVGKAAIDSMELKHGCTFSNYSVL